MADTSHHPHFPKSAPAFGLLSVGAQGVMAFLKEQGVPLPPGLIMAIGIACIIMVVVAAIQIIWWGWQSLKDQIRIPNSALNRALIATRAKLIPLMLAAMAFSGALLIGAAIIGWISYSSDAKLQKRIRELEQQLTARAAPASPADSSAVVPQIPQTTSNATVAPATPQPAPPKKNRLANLELAIGGSNPKGIFIEIQFLTDAEPLTIFVDYEEGSLNPMGFGSRKRAYRGQLTGVLKSGVLQFIIATQFNEKETDTLKWVGSVANTQLSHPMYRVIVTLTDPAGRKQVQSFGLLKIYNTSGPYTYLSERTFAFMNNWDKADLAAEDEKP